MYPGDGGDACEDYDSDSVVDADDNCLDDANPGQTNTDTDLEAAGASVVGDSLGDACDDDDDNDGFDDDVETYLGTDPLDNCPDDPSDDAWPLDMNNDGLLNLGGDISNYVGKIGFFVATNPSCQRLDLNLDGLLNLGGDVALYIGMIGEMCT